jgi:hypothetical protein
MGLLAVLITPVGLLGLQRVMDTTLAFRKGRATTTIDLFTGGAQPAAMRAAAEKYPSHLIWVVPA